MTAPTSDTTASQAFAGFGKFVPGFDFLQNLVSQTAAGASAGAPAAVQPMPGLGSWIAPTLDVEEVERRIKELKTVQFWLDQNATALKATITALEVQKMTLSTLKDMNFNMGEVAQAFQAMAPGAAPAPDASPDKAKTFAGLEVPAHIFGTATSEAPAAPTPAPVEAAPPAAAAAAEPQPATVAGAAASAPAVDPMQWWGALTQQFQTIAAGAMQDVARQAAKQAVKSSQPGPAAAMAEQAVALADTATKTLAGGAALLGKTLRHQAWPSPAKTPVPKKSARPAVANPAKRAAPLAAKSTRGVTAKGPAKGAAKTIRSKPSASAKKAASPRPKSAR